MKRTLIISALLLISSWAWAQIPSGYYSNAEGKTGTELRAALHNIIKGHTSLSYSDLLDAYPYTDCDANGKIWDIYSNYHFNPSNTCGSYNKEGDCYNREHTWPQSWFNEKSGPKSDLFHVMPTDGYVNNRRSNYPYGEVSSPTYTSGNGSKLGRCTVAGYSGTVFEPIDEYKGDIARNFFYMSTRYYGEDAGWSTSPMTNKCEILPWAMTMLLRWSDEDPVSQKEIDRNNAVYGFQGNRNPFIDHPEYARMIWDASWTADTYPITYVANLTHGSVSGPNSAFAGSTVSLVASPDPGYMVDQWNVYKTGSPSTHITVSDDAFTMPEYGVTVSATFKTNDTYYDITLDEVSHGSISADFTSARSGSTIHMTATPESGYHFYAWYVYKTGDMNTTVPVSGNSFTMPAFNVSIRATFNSQGGGNGDYVKVTETPSDWSGEYLIVCENQNVAFNGTVSNNWGLCSAVNIANNTITSNATTEGYKIIISHEDSGYKFLLPSGKYMSWTSRDFKESTTATAYSITLEDGNAIIKKGTYILKYNHNNGSGGLRSYTTGQTDIQLYKKQGGCGNTPTHTIHFYPNGGIGESTLQEVPEFTPTTLYANTFTREHFCFDGWNTEANGTGTYYADEATVTITDDLDLFALWDPQYPILLAETSYGTLSTNKTWAIDGEEVTLSATANEGYELDHWTVTDGSGNNIFVDEEGHFEMPADTAFVSATFRMAELPYTQEYHLVTSTDMLVTGRTYLIVGWNGDDAYAASQQRTANRGAVNISISDGVTTPETATNKDDEGHPHAFVLGGNTDGWTLYDPLEEGYLYAANSSSNQLKTQAINDANGTWAISISEGEASIVAQGSNTRNDMRFNYNNGTPLVSCYSSTTTQKPVSLYLRSEDYHIATNTVRTNLVLFDFDRCTVSNGATLTVTDDVVTTTQTQITLKDGAQLIQPSNGVRIAMEKNVEAYISDDNGWHCIASPLAEPTTLNEIEGLATESFDLYTLGTEDWIIKKDGNETLTNGEGYLFAHSDDQMPIRFVGIAIATNQNSTKNLYYNSAAPERSYSLVGNPFTCNALVNRSYFSLVENGGQCSFMEKTINDPVPPCTSIMVKATAEGDTITFTPVQ